MKKVSYAAVALLVSFTAFTQTIPQERPGDGPGNALANCLQSYEEAANGRTKRNAGLVIGSYAAAGAAFVLTAGAAGPVLLGVFITPHLVKDEYGNEFAKIGKILKAAESQSLNYLPLVQLTEEINKNRTKNNLREVEVSEVGEILRISNSSQRLCPLLDSEDKDSEQRAVFDRKALKQLINNEIKL